MTDVKVTDSNNMDVPPAQEPDTAQSPQVDDDTTTGEDEEEQTMTLLIAPPTDKAPLVKLEHVSANDTVLSLRQLIAEYPTLAGYTCYHLEVRVAGSDAWVALNDYVELGEYADVVDNATLKMVIEKYDARKVRAHVRRFREVLSNPPIPQHINDDESDDAAAAANGSPAMPAATATSTTKAGKSSKNKSKKSKQVGSSDAATTALATNGTDAKKAGEISEQQLQQLRAIHAKLERVTVPVAPLLEDFYTLPGAATATATATSESADKPSKSVGNSSNKSKKHAAKQQAQPPTPVESNAALDTTLPTCVKSIAFSGYNPPPGPRKLAGDLMYLAVTIPGSSAVLHITAHVDGFFVNRSSATAFDPRPLATTQTPTHLLVDVLAAASAPFKTAYAALLAKSAQLAKQGPASIEWMLAAGNNVGGKLAWNTPATDAAATHTFDVNRAEDELMNTYGHDERGMQREWNEEYQCCRELPRTTLQDEIVRARVLYKIVTEFVEAATQGAVAIVEGQIPPINPMDDASAHVYVFNNIFFSLSVDGKVTAAAKDAATDEAAYSSANRDLQGVKAFNDADIPGLHTLATAVVDYLGMRVIAQSVIPGILQGEAASKLIYGSVDGGKTIASNPKMHALMLQAGEKLHIAERSIQPLGVDSDEAAAVEAAADEAEDAAAATATAGGEAGTEVVSLCGPVEAKGILGSDGRMYVLDLVRITPKDATYYKTRDATPEAPSSTTDSDDGLCFRRQDEGYVALLRPELVQLYSLWKQNQVRKEKHTALEATKDAAKAANDDASEGADAADESDIDVPPIRLNPNVSMKYKASINDTEVAADEAAANDAAAYLQTVVVPAFLADIRRGSISPADGVALTELMHSCGINMRYLGRLASLAKKLESIGGISKYVLELLEVEMIARATKHVLADVLNADDATRAAPGAALVQILNGLLGAATATSVADTSKDASSADVGPSGKKSKSSKHAAAKTTAPTTAAVTSALSATDVWRKIETEIANRFDYKLTLWHRDTNATAADDAAPLGRVHKTVLLRRLCQRNGLRVVSRNYDFATSPTPFTIDDLTGVVPVVKHSLPLHPLPQATQLLERGRLHLSSGSLATAYEMLQETSALLFQVCGAAHEDAALCSTSLATVLYHAGDVAGAIAQQQRALALYTQLAGMDYHDTAFAHANLALFLHANGQTDVAVAHVCRAIYLLELGSGPHYPEISALYFKMGMMCQDVGQISLALLCHRESLKRGELDRVQAANTLHQMALACGLAGGFREALAYEKKVYALLQDAFGESDPRVLEAAQFMAKFTERAVEGAKNRIVNVDAAAQADAIAHELLEELTIKEDAPVDGGNSSSSNATKKNKSKKNKNKKH